MDSVLAGFSINVKGRDNLKHEVTTLMTKRALADSLKKFMVKKPLSKISIREIIEDCGVNRQTFYYHFQDINDLVEWMFEQEAICLLKKSDSCLTWNDGLFLLFNYVSENQKICECALNSLGRNYLEHLFYNEVTNLVGNIVRQLSEGLTVEEKYIEFISKFYTLSFASLLVEWLKQGMKEKPEEVMQLLDITIHGNIRAALERAADSESSLQH